MTSAAFFGQEANQFFAPGGASGGYTPFPMIPLVPPTGLTTFYTAPGGTVTTDSAGVVITQPAAGLDMTFVGQTVNPAAAFTATCVLQRLAWGAPGVFAYSTFSMMDSTSARLISATFLTAGGIDSAYYLERTLTAIPGGNIAEENMFGSRLTFLQFRYDGSANWSLHWSVDGYYYAPMFSGGTTYLTGGPDRVGFGAGNIGSPFSGSVRCVHWEVVQ